MEKDILYNEIIEILLSLGYSLKNIGTYYIAEAIYECYYKKDVFLLHIEKNIYSILASKHNKSISTIKSNIEKATNNMYLYGYSKVRKQYFNYYDNTKPTTKVVILTILNNIKNRHF